MDSPDKAPSVDRSSQSTGMFSNTSSSDAIPSTVIAPKAAHLRVPAAPVDAASASGGGASAVSRWSDGTFGSAAAASESPSHSSEGAAANSSTYSGKPGEATTAQTADAKVVDMSAGGAGGASPTYDSAVFVGMMTKVDPVDLGIVLSSGDISRSNKLNRKQN